MNSFATKFQLGKNKISEGVIKSLTQDLKNHKQVRVSVLKSYCRNKEELKSIKRELLSRLPFKCEVKIIGYTIILRRAKK